MTTATIIDTCRDSDRARAFMAAVEIGTAGLTAVSPGVCPGCRECQEAFGFDDSERFDDEVSRGAVCDEGGFSSCQCESCGSGLAGDRFYAHGIGREAELSAGEIVHFPVCVDCLLYLANGDLPEKWEG